MLSIYILINIGLFLFVCIIILLWKFWNKTEPEDGIVIGYDEKQELDRHIKLFQTHYAQQNHTAQSTSFVIPSTLEQSLCIQDQRTIVPNLVSCIEVFPHRKIFISHVEWIAANKTKYEGFVKECMNPLEVQLHRRLHHKNIAQFFWSNIADRPQVCDTGQRMSPIYYYCMEYCRGGSLSKFLVKEGHTISLDEMLDIITDIVTGVRYLHGLGVAHRDLKTENILIQYLSDGNEPRHAKIGDFDHAINTNNSYEFNIEVKQKRNFGSPLYTAPEFILEIVQVPKREDFIQNDMYSLGLVLWECITWVKCKHNMHNKSQPYNGVENENPRLESSITAPLVLRTDNDVNQTNDIGHYRDLVKCSSTVHIPLIKQICDTLNLKYNKDKEVLQKNGLFLKKDCQIDSGLMVAFYSKDVSARPVLFRSNKRNLYTKEINEILAGCWTTLPENRFSAARVLKMLVDRGDEEDCY